LQSATILNGEDISKQWDNNTIKYINTLSHSLKAFRVSLIHGLEF
jgi:hypothetical protein